MDLRTVAALVGAMLFLTVGCSAGSSAPPAPSATPWPPAGAQIVSGGCEKTQVLTGIAPPQWALAGFSGKPTQLPWALSDSGRSLAYLFATHLVAGGVRRDGSSNKVLWVVKHAGAPAITAHPAGAATPRIDIGGQGTNGNQMPSSVDLPSPGCWSFELSWGKSTDRLSLEVLPQASLPT
jgi:hypothetical protein